MRVIALYRPNTEHERPLTELNRELQRRYNSEIELLSADTRSGADLASVYGVMMYPSILVLDQEGVLQHSWTDGQLPLINELSYYLQQA